MFLLLLFLWNIDYLFQPINVDKKTLLTHAGIWTLFYYNFKRFDLDIILSTKKLVPANHDKLWFDFLEQEIKFSLNKHSKSILEIDFCNLSK